MANDLRPLNTVEMLDAAWLVVRRHWLPLFAASTVGTVPLAALLIGYFLWLGRLVGEVENRDFYQGTAWWALMMAAAWTVHSVSRAAVTRLALQALRREPVDAGAAWTEARRSAPGSAFIGLVGFSLAWFGATCLLVPGLLLVMGWWVGRPVLLEERRPYLAALRRSWRLTEGYRFRALGLWLLLVGTWILAVLNLHLLLQLLLGVAADFLGLELSGLRPRLSLGNQAYTLFLTAVVLVVLDPIKTVVDALFYLDLRIRREGADLHARLQGLRAGAGLASVLFLLAATPAAAVPVDAYVEQVQAVRRQIHAAGGPRAVDPKSIEGLGRATVELPGGQPVPVDNSWITDGLKAWERGEGGEAREQKVTLLRRLDALERSLRGLGAPLPNGAPIGAEGALEASGGGDPKEAVKRILQEPEFQPLAERPELRELLKNVDLRQPGNWWTSFWKWVKEKLFQPAEPRAQTLDWRLPDLGLLEPGFYVILALAVLYLLATLVRWCIERPLREGGRAAAVASGVVPPLEASATENALDHTVDEWEVFAQQWLGQGEVRQAVRALYLATLVHLHRERKIEYNRALTNWIYVRQFRGESEQRRTLRQLTQVFDEVWYGERACGDEVYRRFEEGVRTLGTPAPAAGGGTGGARG